MDNVEVDDACKFVTPWLIAALETNLNHCHVVRAKDKVPFLCHDPNPNLGLSYVPFVI